MRTFLPSILLVLGFLGLQLIQPLQAQLVTGTIGVSAVAPPNTDGPTHASHQSRRGQIIYTVAELNAAGITGPTFILAVGFFHTQLPNVDLQNFRLFMGHTVATSAGTFNPNTSQVFFAPSYRPTTVNDFEMISLDTPFLWNGTENLVLDHCFGLNPSANTSGQVRMMNAPLTYLSERSNVFNLCGQAINTGAPLTRLNSFKPFLRLLTTQPGAQQFDSLFATQGPISSVRTGTSNATILRVNIRVSGVAPAIPVSAIAFNTNGSTSPATDLTAARLYATGTNPNFSTANPLATVSNPSGSFTFNFGAQALQPGDNYFWLAYDVSNTAGDGNQMDARLVSVTVDGVVRTPLAGAGDPAGTRPIYNPFATLPYFQGFESAWTSLNATRDVPSLNWVNTPPTGNNSWRRNDDGLAASWTSSTVGAYTPTGSDLDGTPSQFSARWHSYWADTTGHLDLYLNFSPTGTKVLDFDRINTSGADSLFVRLSTDGGQTFGPIIARYGTTLGWERLQDVVLGTSTSNEVVLRFTARIDPIFLDFSDIGIDNVRVRLALPNDIGATALLGPESECGLGNERLTVQLRNYGNTPVTGFTVGFTDGTQTVTETVPAGFTLAPFSTVSYTFTATGNFGTTGEYPLRIFTRLAADPNSSNDTSAIQRLTHVQTVSTFPYNEPFNTRGGWTHRGTRSSWAFGNPLKQVIVNAASAPSCWVNGGLTARYPNGERSFLYSPCFDFSSLQNPVVQFSIWWETNRNDDGVVLQSSIDGGQTWQVVGDLTAPPSYNWYNDNAISSQPAGQPVGWSGSGTLGSGNWRTARNVLRNLGGQANVRFRFAFSSSPTLTVFDGVAIDNFIIREGPVVSIGPDQTICQGDTATFNATAGFASYSWSITGAGNSPTARTSTAGSVSVRVTDTDGFTGEAQATVTVLVPTFDLGPTQSVCANVPVPLDATDAIATSYLWSTGATTPRITATQPGVYTVQVIAQGCVFRDTVRINHFPYPELNLGADTAFCAGGTLLLDASVPIPNATYQWNNGATTPRLFISSPGTYSVLVSSPNGCSNNDTIRVSVLAVPLVNLGPDIFQCTGLNVTLDAGNPGSSYQWSSGQSSRTIQVTQPGIYTVKVTNPAGCNASDTIAVGQNPFQPANLGPDRTNCGPLLLSAGGGATRYIWSTGDTTQSILVTQSGTYLLQVEDPFGCQDIDDVNIVILEKPVAGISGPDTVITGLATQWVDASFPIPTQWRWNFGDGSAVKTQQNPSHTYSQDGEYTITLIVSNANCSDTVIQTVVVERSGTTARIAASFDDLRVYPNPVQRNLTISGQMPTAGELALSLWTLNGQEVWRETHTVAAQWNLQVLLPQLPAGPYLLRLSSDSARAQLKLLLQP